MLSFLIASFNTPYCSATALNSFVVAGTMLIAVALCYGVFLAYLGLQARWDETVIDPDMP